MTQANRKRGRPRTLPDLICETCGTAFRPYASGSRFCSRKCFGAWHSQHGTYKAVQDEKVCPACGRTFYVGGAGLRRSKKFCSLECAGKPRAPEARTLSETEAAWLAGVFDGEGSIVRPRIDKPRSLRLSVTNTSMPLLEHIQTVTGTGSIIVHNKGENPRHSRSWIWQVHADNARSLLRQMLPWLIVKRDKAEQALRE